MANQITVFLDPTQIPNRQVQDQQVFDGLVAAMFANLPVLGAQLNTVIANLNASFSGNAYAIPYTIDLSGTSDIDPGAGKLRFDNVTQNLATTLRLDLLGTGAPAVDYTAMIDTFDASTSTVKGHIRIVKLGDASKFLMFSVSARTAPTGYRDISVTPVASSSANPFLAGDGVLLFFQRTGDRGDTGTGYYTLLTQATVSTAVANIDFLNAFNSGYDNYILELNGFAASANGVTLNAQFANAGAVDSGANYAPMTAPTPAGATMGAVSSTPLQLGLIGSSVFLGSFTLELRNANAIAGKRKSVSIRGSSAGNAYAGEAAYDGGVISGIRFAPSSGTFTAGTIRIYGLKNS